MPDLGTLHLDLDRHVVVAPTGERTSLTQLEVDAMRHLVAARGDPVPRRVLEAEVWQMAPESRSEAVPVAMRRLRKKVGPVLQTVVGVGWRLVGMRPDAEPPRPLIAWFPRPALLDTVCASLDGPGWTWLFGPSGVGKTRLAIEACTGRRALFVECRHDPLTPELLLADLAHVLGVASDTEAAVRSSLVATGSPLVVVDDLHTVAPEALQVLATLSTAATWLCTAQHACEVAEVTLIEVPPLDAPRARAFFLARCAPVQPDERHVDAVLARVGGLPGALTLLASRAWTGLDPLSDPRDPSPGLTEAVRQTWQALGPQARHALGIASALGAPVPPEDLLAAGAGVHGLAQLRRCSLLQPIADGRLAMLPAVRAHCLLQADPSGSRHSAYAWVVERAEGLVADLDRHPGQSLLRLRMLHDPLRRAAEAGDPEQRVRATLALARTMALTGPTTARVAVVQRCLDDPAVTVLRDALRGQLAPALLAAGASPAQVRAVMSELSTPSATRLRALLARWEGDVDLAQRLLRDAVQSASFGSTQHVRSRHDLVCLQPDPAEVTSGLRDLVDLCLQVGNRLVLPEALVWLAMCRMAAGDADEAQALLGRALDACRAEGLARTESMVWGALGICRSRGDLELTAQAFERAMRCAAAQGDLTTREEFLVNMALAAYCLDRPQQTLAAISQMQTLHAGDASFPIALVLRGAAHLRLGDPLEAELCLVRVDVDQLGTYYDPERGPEHGRALIGLARIAADLDDPSEEARGRVEAAVRLGAPHVGSGIPSAIEMLVRHARELVRRRVP